MLSRKEKNELKKQIGELLKGLSGDLSRKEKNDAKREIGALMKRLGEAEGKSIKPMTFDDDALEISASEKLKRIKLGAFLKNIDVHVDSKTLEKAYRDYYQPLIDGRLSKDSLDKNISINFEESLRLEKNGITKIKASLLDLLIRTLDKELKNPLGKENEWEKPYVKKIIEDLEQSLNASLDPANSKGLDLQGFEIVETGGDIIGDALKLTDKRLGGSLFIVYPQDENGEYLVSAMYNGQKASPSLPLKKLQEAVGRLANIRDNWIENTAQKSIHASEKPDVVDIESQFPDIADKYKNIIDVTGRGGSAYKEKLFLMKTTEDVALEISNLRNLKQQIQLDQSDIGDNPYFIKKLTKLHFMEVEASKRYISIQEEQTYNRSHKQDIATVSETTSPDLERLIAGDFDDLDLDPYLAKITEISDAMGGDIEPFKEPMIRYIEKRLETA